MLPTIESTLNAGNYVYYTDGKGIRRTCVVLYDSSSPYGIEIITMDTVENVELGNGTGSVSWSTSTENFNTAMNSYNNAITTLNSRASAYNNGIYSTRARCVGSLPNNPDYDETGMYTRSESWFSSYNGKFKNTDNKYETDWSQMVVLGIQNLDKRYWLASRYVTSGSSDNIFGVVYAFAYGEGSFDNNHLCRVHSSDSQDSVSIMYGLRPVFHLKPGIKVTGGSGTENDPYTLGI